MTVELTVEEAAKQLSVIHLRTAQLIERVQRKRRIRASEQAMWIVDLQRDRVAIEMSYKALTGKDLVKRV